MLCILYVIAVSWCLGLVGLMVDRALPVSWARRWLWSTVIALSIAIPAIYQTKHRILVGDGTAPMPAGTAGLSFMSPDWVARIQAFDAAMGRFWVMVSASIIIWGLIGAWRVFQIVRQSRQRQKELGAPTIVDGVPVVVTDQVGPATVGMWRSRVLVPRWVLALPGVQRQYVIRHEEEHRRAHDGRLLFAASLFLIVLPWNIALWWLLRRLRLAVELDCDNRVVKALGDPNAYGRLLLTVAQATTRGPRLQPAFLGGGMLEHRLTMLLAPTPLRHVQRYLLPVLAVAILLVVLSMPHPVLRHTAATHDKGIQATQVAASHHEASHR